MDATSEALVVLGAVPDPDLVGQVSWHDGWRAWGSCDVCPRKAAVWLRWLQITDPRFPKALSRSTLAHDPEVDREWRNSGGCVEHAREVLRVTLTREDRMPDSEVQVDVCGWAHIWGAAA